MIGSARKSKVSYIEEGEEQDEKSVSDEEDIMIRDGSREVTIGKSGDALGTDRMM
jgi:hypothetical protein